MTVDVTAGSGNQSRPPSATTDWRGGKKDNALDCVYFVRIKENVSDTCMCAQMSGHAEANKSAQ